MAKKSGQELVDTAKNMVLGSLAGKNKVVKTVDATPDWVGLVPLFMDWIQNGNTQQYEEAKRNLLQMARISDSYRKHKSLFEASPDMYNVLEEAKQELSNTGCGADEWMGKLLKKISSALTKADKK